MKLKNTFKKDQPLSRLAGAKKTPTPKKYSEKESFERVQSAMEKKRIPTDRVQDLGDRAAAVIKDPKKWAEMRAWLISNRVPAENLPEEPDMQRLAGIVAMAETARRNKKGQ